MFVAAWLCYVIDNVLLCVCMGGSIFIFSWVFVSFFHVALLWCLYPRILCSSMSPQHVWINLVPVTVSCPAFPGPITPLTHWGSDKMAAKLRTTILNAFSWMKIYELRLRFHRSLFPRIQLTILPVTSHYLNQWWLVSWRIYASLGLNELTITKNCYSLLPWVRWYTTEYTPQFHIKNKM